MKLVTYNLRLGGASRLHWSRIIKAFDPEILLTQESFAPSEHLSASQCSDLKKRTAWCSVESQAWGSAVYVKQGIVRPLELEDFRGWLVGAEVEGVSLPAVRVHRLRVFSIHAPKRGSYAMAVNSILDLIDRHRGDGDLIIGGDFNLCISQRQLSEGRITEPADMAIQERLRDEFGLLNCWQVANPNVPLAQTLRWSREPTFPYHCDGLFVPASWRTALISCAVEASEEWRRLSDHNPVVATFQAGSLYLHFPSTWGNLAPSK